MVAKVGRSTDYHGLSGYDAERIAADFYVCAPSTFQAFDLNFGDIRNTEASPLPFGLVFNGGSLDPQHFAYVPAHHSKVSARLASEYLCQCIPLSLRCSLVQIQSDPPLHLRHMARGVNRESNIEPVQRDISNSTAVDVPPDENRTLVDIRWTEKDTLASGLTVARLKVRPGKTPSVSHSPASSWFSIEPNIGQVTWDIVVIQLWMTR